ncbi:MAG: hypothetical protein H8D45_24170 [Bacteroidetes bacterium]|nr:hypothetical protein [Bacteroidota bacterium]
MKKLIFVFVIFITAFQFSFSQPYQTVYTANYYITKFFSFKITNNPVKKIFFQEMGLTGDPCPTDPVGFYTFQINKNNFQTYQPCNGFLGRHECTVYTFGCDRHSVDFFRFSNQDSNLVFKYTYYPGAPSPQCAPFKRSKISSNWGMSSTTLFNNQTLYGYDINPVNDNIMYAGVEDNINKSTNRGNSWSVVSALTDLDGIVRINPLRTNYVFAAGTGNMYLSTNGGSSFSSLTAPPFKKIAFNLNDSSVYGITSTGVYKSVNHGMNWSHGI